GRLVGVEVAQPRQGEVVVADGEDEGGAGQVRAAQPDAAEDAVVLEEGVEQAAGAAAAGGANGQGVVADRHIGIAEAGGLEVVQEVAEDRRAPEVDEDLVALLAEVLEARG